ncbi:phosphoribosylformylglycinamidine cyclo-ligase [uncultured Jatrophihabitans sp.]|uniref:phosphoribosylformylglycinamidine cyclo-ligase n=1 Tax=uncultured Jatrophihabitans sp. TaxID=1610747 RepID=UPI0035C985DF
MTTDDQPRDAYARAGVDIAAGDRAVELMKSSVARTERPETIGGLGGFAGLFRLDLAKYPQPVLASSTDGVGTKLAVAQALDRHDTIGIDLVAMVVDDLVVAGAEPLVLTDYIATGKVDARKIATIVGGVADGCVQAGCALVGGETAEHPGVMGVDEYDISGTGVGVVNADAILGPERVRAGDVLIAMASSGLHSNGYSLVRQVLLEQGGLDLRAPVPGIEAPTLGDELLTPTRIYALDCLALAAECGAHAFAHITGGGLAGNLVRVLPDGVAAVVDRSTWTPQPIFDLVRTTGSLPRDDLERALNLGVGMVAVVAPERADDAVALLIDRGVPAWRLGETSAAQAAASVRLVGDYADTRW